MDQAVLNAVAIILVAVLPSVAYLIWIRNTERRSRERYSRLAIVFLLGATLSIAVAVVIELVLMNLLDTNIERVYQILGEDPNLSSLLLACVIAPVVEELAKAIGIFQSRGRMTELENGIVFGAAAGLGFAATENLLYEGAAYLSAGAAAWIATAVVRSLSSALLHATASSLLGLGVARSVLKKSSWLPYYLGAVIMHGLFNFTASFGQLYESDLGDVAYLIGLVAAFVIAILGISIMRSKIRSLERNAI
jgi:RsiW-degrading membrane proteinase PrsW (M82 family)